MDEPLPKAPLSWAFSPSKSPRRKGKAFFIDVLALYLEGKISRQVFRRIVNKSAITVPFEIVEPMEWHLNPNYDFNKFYKIMLVITDLIYAYEIETDNQFRNGATIKRVKEEEDIKANDSTPKGDSADNATGKTKPQK